MRGRINVPLHSFNDVIVVALLIVALFSVAGWLLSGRGLTDLTDFLQPKALATVLEIEIVLVGAAESVRAELAGLLPVKEAAVPSAALGLAQQVGGILIAHRDLWRFGALHSVRVAEPESPAAWNAAWQRTQLPVAAAGEALIVKLVVLVSGRALQPPRQVTRETLERLLKGLAALDVPRLAAFAAAYGPAAEVPALTAL